VLFYDLASGVLESRKIGTVYGVKNLYKDVKNIRDVYEIEKKLSLLESQASKAISIVLQASGQSSFRLTRKSLNDMRKFLFIMHFRNARLSAEYFRDSPDQFSARDWLEAYGKTHGLESATEMWLHALRYYLDTPHVDLMHYGREIREKHGDKLIQMLLTRIDPNEEHFHSLAYEGVGSGFFTCIWEAADGEEFIMSSNSFGLWEGVVSMFPGIHRFFVLSPRMAVVLSVNLVRPEVFSELSKDKNLSFFSTLLDVKHNSPIPTYPGGAPTDEKSLAEIIGREEDSFEFKITKLSVPQTREVNAIVLVNVHDEGSVTFASKASMLRTLRPFCGISEVPTGQNLLLSSTSSLTSLQTPSATKMRR
jgi:Protein of unknown function (DUF4238)